MAKTPRVPKQVSSKQTVAVHSKSKRDNVQLPASGIKCNVTSNTRISDGTVQLAKKSKRKHRNSSKKTKGKQNEIQKTKGKQNKIKKAKYKNVRPMPSNSLKLATTILRDEKCVSSNWEKLSKALGIDTNKVRTAPCDISSLANNECQPKAVPQNRNKSVSKEAAPNQVSNYANCTVSSVATSETPHTVTESINFKRSNESKIQQPKDQPSSSSVTENIDQDLEVPAVNLCIESIHRPELLTKVLAMDCEMVGVGEDGIDSNLARISLVNANGECVYDKFVQPVETVTDYRTHVSGVRPENLENAEDLFTVQKEVAEMIKERTLVGHSLKNDFKVLYISHPRRRIRDTAKYRTFRSISSGGTPSLKKLAKHFLQMDIQTGEHNSIQDAQAAMNLYQIVKKEWEMSIKFPHKHVQKGGK